MRFLLIIPVLVLFLSNVPIIQKMPLAEAVVMMARNEGCAKQKECSRNSENLKASCSAEESDCDKDCKEKNKAMDPDTQNSCEKTATSCICIYCFQYAAPINIITEYTFNCSFSSNTAHAFIPARIGDPHTCAPWQPPERV